MTKFNEVKDSGQRAQFGTGAVRDLSEHKGRFDLISPIALERIAQHYENGARKYSDRNWEKGIPLHSFIDSAMRHINKIQLGCTDEDHAAAAAWNIIGFIHTKEMIERGLLPKELDDMPNYQKLINKEVLCQGKRIQKK